MYSRRPYHRARRVSRLLAANDVQMLLWPTNSTDFNLEISENCEVTNVPDYRKKITYV